MVLPKPLPVKQFTSPAAWQAWLEKYQTAFPGVWLQFAKKSRGTLSFSHSDALEVALCYGWIDGQRAASTPDFWRVRFTPRAAGSRWSQINCAAVERLQMQGRMTPSGRKQVAEAKQDGRWAAAYAPQRTITVPEDLQTALDTHPRAKRFFAKLDSKNRYAILYRLQDAKKPETRQRRLKTFLRMLEAGETLHERPASTNRRRSRD